MKSNLFILFLLISLLKKTLEEKSILELLIDGITNVKNLSSIESNKNNDTEEEKIIEENIYEMNSTKDFDLNIQINGTENNSIVILFYSMSCIHCKRFLPIYREISELLKNDTSIKFSKIQFSLCENIFKRYTQLKLKGVPSIFLYRKGHFTRFEGPRSKDTVMSFINKIKNYECNEIRTLEELAQYINRDIIFSKDEEKQFVLGIFKKSKEFDKNFIINNYLELNVVSNDIVLNNRCYYFFKDEIIDMGEIDKNNFYLKQALYGKKGEIGEYSIYSYNYQKGLNTFNLFGTFLHIQNNYSKIGEFNDSNSLKYIQIIKNKYKNFLDENYLYKYYYINNSEEVYNFSYYDKKLFIFYHQTYELRKFYIEEINYILSLNHSLNCNYLFILFNTSNEKVNKRKRVSFYNLENYDNTVLLMEEELNTISIESKILEYINKDRKHLLKPQPNIIQMAIKGIYDLFGWGKNSSQNNLININEKDFEQELIDEINKTIIEDEKIQKEEFEKRINQSDNSGKKNLKNLKSIQKRRKILDSFKNEEIGFNKNLILFPLFLIIYSIIFFICYKYVFGNIENKIFYKRIPTEDPKNK